LRDIRNFAPVSASDFGGIDVMNAMPDLQSVLIIDDDPVVADILETIFDGEVRISSALSGREGIEAARAEAPDLILLDVRMRDMDGYETLKQLKQITETADVPVVFLTAKTQTEDEYMGLELGAFDYISKPIIPQIVKVRIHNHLLLKQQRDQLANMSMIDGLTGIANRRRFDDYLDQEFRRGARNHYPVSLLMLDIDDFKPFNDTYGHQSGDDCLQRIAAEIQTHSRRPSDLVARYGGEEFALILPDTPLDAAIMLAENIRAGIEALAITHEGARAVPFVTISIGVASTEDATIAIIDDLIEAADKRFYRAKESGRNRVCDTLE
jgi:diguanylate cyclase (GGDEF)-like protein